MDDSDDRPLAGFILALIGGILILVDGVIVAALGGTASALGIAGGGLLVGLGALGAFLGFLVLVLAIVLFVAPDYHLPVGVAILVFSLLSLLSGGGFILGLVLGVVGGILGIIFSPSEDLEFDAAFPSGPFTGRTCPRCATRVPQGPDRYCPSCGGAL